MPLANWLKERIAAEGPITVAAYMEAATAHPEFGYYVTRDPFGKGGDFTTAPEISQIFGELIGAWLARQWQSMGKPRCTLLEMGPGRGTLMRDMLHATKKVPGFHEALDAHLLEISPVLEALQRKTLADSHPRIHWMRDLSALPALPLLFVANEFFDALPVHQFVGNEERRVGWDDTTNQLHFLPEGEVTQERCPAAEHIISHLAAHISTSGGSGLIVDYGYAGRQHADTLQAVRAHQKVHPLESPGEADLTAHVDFTALAKAAGTTNVFGPIPQGTFLKRLGAELRATALCRNATPDQCEQIVSGLERLVSPVQMGELFKVMALTHPALPAPEGF